MLNAIRGLLIDVVHAQPANLHPPDSPDCDALFQDGGFGAPGLGFRCYADYGRNLTFVIIAFAASICLVMLIVNGFRYMIGPAVPGGSSDAAKKGIGAALVGLAVSLLTYIILDTIVSSVTQ